MPSESSGLNENFEQAQKQLSDLRQFQGPAREFWPQFIQCVGQLTDSMKVAVLFRPPIDPQAEADPEKPLPAPAWRKIGEWAGGGGASKVMVAFTGQLAQVAEECVTSGKLFQPLSGSADGHYVMAVRLVLNRAEEVCVVTCLVTAPTEEMARQSLMRLGLAADVPASYQSNLAGQQARTDVQKFAGTLDLMAQVNTEERFLAAALAFCNGLATHFRCDRVSLGWLQGGYIKLRAISRTEKFDRQMAAARALEIAMEECLDQDDEVVWPPPENASVVTRDHHNFADEQKSGHVVSLPLRVGDKTVAVVTCERQSEPFSELELQELRLSCDQVARRMSELQRHDRWFGARWATAAREKSSKIVGPEHTVAKVVAILVTLVLAVFLFWPVNYRVEGTFILRSDEVAFLTVPFDGYIDSVDVRPGDEVPKEGALLRLETDQLELEESAALADLNRYTREAEKARAAQNLAEMRISNALAQQSQARLDLVRHRLDQATIKSPFVGVVVEGDLRERLGSHVKQGDALFKVARIDTLYVEAKVSEEDVHELIGKSTGEIAFVSQPKLKFPVRIDRVEPAAFPENEGNMFIVRCGFVNAPEGWWKPGMSGLCKLDVDKRTLLWIFTHETVDFLRMMLWW